MTRTSEALPITTSSGGVPDTFLRRAAAVHAGQDDLAVAVADLRPRIVPIRDRDRLFRGGGRCGSGSRKWCDRRSRLGGGRWLRDRCACEHRIGQRRSGLVGRGGRRGRRLGAVAVGTAVRAAPWDAPIRTTAAAATTAASVSGIAQRVHAAFECSAVGNSPIVWVVACSNGASSAGVAVPVANAPSTRLDRGGGAARSS